MVCLVGATHRNTVLKRLAEEVGPLAAIVPRSLAERSSWARSIVTAWIEWDDRTDPENWGPGAWAALAAWLAEPGHAAPRGCMSYDEWGVELCSYLCAEGRLGLPCTPLASLQLARDKVCFRELCVSAGIPSPRSARISDITQLEAALSEGEWQFPVILKPAKGAGSYYVRKVDGPDSLRPTFAQIDEMARSEGKLLPPDFAAGWAVEEFFTGSEVDVDGWAKDGEVGWMSVADNKPASASSRCETGGFYPSVLPRPAVEALEALTRDVVRATSGYTGAFHFEALVNVETFAVMPIELNCRVGSAECPASVEATSGVYLPLVAADLALGHTPRSPRPPRFSVVASSNVSAPHAGVVRACRGSEELQQDPALVGAQFYCREVQEQVSHQDQHGCPSLHGLLQEEHEERFVEVHGRALCSSCEEGRGQSRMDS